MAKSNTDIRVPTFSQKINKLLNEILDSTTVLLLYYFRSIEAQI